jgi:adenosine deaminase
MRIGRRLSLPPKYTDLADCLTRAAVGITLMQSKEQLRMVTADLAAFRYAADNNIPCTAHAGEALGPDSVWVI